MNMYFAPLEGITGFVYRNAFQKIFCPHIDKYFSPFISPGVNQPFTPKELRDIAPENNRGINLIPQILANNSRDFLLAAKHIEELGYKEININMGCPSGTVTAKKKGSGLLADTDMLQRFLDGIFENSSMCISIKTRLGYDSLDAYEQILDIFYKYPVSELIIHPRLRIDFYKNRPDMISFGIAYERFKTDLCYNGDICSLSDYKNIVGKYPDLKSVMIGRGFLKNPFLACIIGKDKSDEEIISSDAQIRQTLLAFHNELLQGYECIMSGDRPVLFKMKELMTYMQDMFKEPKSYMKKIMKSEKLNGYIEAAEMMINCCELQ